MPVSQEGKKATGKKEMADRQWDSFCFNFPSFVLLLSPLWITVLSLLVFWAIELYINLNFFFFFFLFPNTHLENSPIPVCLVLVRPTVHFQIVLPRGEAWSCGWKPRLEARKAGPLSQAGPPRLCSASRSPWTSTGPAVCSVSTGDKQMAAFVGL